MFGKLFRFLASKKNLLGFLIIASLPLLFFWKFFLKGLIPVPADIIVGTSFPFRGYVWDNFVAGVPVKNGLISDVVSQLYPWRLLAAWEWQKGHVPLWNPYILGGMPLMANVQSAVFYPLNFIFFFWPNGISWGITIILQVALSFWFMFLFLREVNFSKIVSTFGALIFAFNGFSLFWLEWGSLVAVACWLPLLLWAIEKMDKNKENWLGYWLIFILGMAMSVLAGHFQISFYVGLAAFIYALFKGKRTIFLVVLGGLFSLSLTAFQLLPAFEAYRLSIRDTEGMIKQYHYGFLRLANFATLIAPDFFGNPGTGNWWGFGKGIELTLYVGLVALFFFFFSLFNFRRNWKKSFFRVAMVILGLSLILLLENPISLLFYQKVKIPGLSSSPANRIIFLFNFSLCLGAVVGLSNLEKKFSWHILKKVFLVFGMFFLILWGVVFYSLRIYPLFVKEISFWRVSFRNLILPTLILTALFFWLIFFSLFKASRKILLMGLVFLLMFDLFREGWKFNSFSRKEWLFPEIPETEYLREKAGINRVEGAISPNMKMPYKIQSVSGYEILIPRRIAEFLAACNAQRGEAIKHPEGRYAGFKKPISRCGQLYGVKYLLTGEKGPPEELRTNYNYEGVKPVWKKEGSTILEYEGALPRLFLVDEYQVGEDPVAIARLMIEDEDFLLDKKVALEEEGEWNLDDEKEELAADIKLLGYYPNAVLLNVLSNKDALLFLSDNYYPGWQAFVDDKETKIYRANYAFRSVFVPKGEHLVRFVYRPQSLRVGAIVSIITNLLLLTRLIFFKFNQKKK